MGIFNQTDMSKTRVCEHVQIIYCFFYQKTAGKLLKDSQNRFLNEKFLFFYI